ncbi:hypothetical protein B0E38_03443 [Streptomyces sp. 111WW2]|nr:hypothetical protein B0E38_03443 [Streptomyces sp. 111WW2]
MCMDLKTSSHPSARRCGGSTSDAASSSPEAKTNGLPTAAPGLSRRARRATSTPDSQVCGRSAISRRCRASARSAKVAPVPSHSSSSVLPKFPTHAAGAGSVPFGPAASMARVATRTVRVKEGRPDQRRSTSA